MIGVLKYIILVWIKVTLKFKGFKNNIIFIKYLWLIFRFEKKNINDRAWIIIVGEKYSNNILLGNWYLLKLKKIYSEVMKENIIYIKKGNKSKIKSLLLKNLPIYVYIKIVTIKMNNLH